MHRGPGARSASAWTMRSVGAALVVALLSVPFAVMVLGALHAPGAPPPVGLELFPGAPSLSAFERAFALVPLGRQLLNSLTIVVIAVPLTVACASLTGYAITRLGRPWHGVAIGFTLVCLTIPAAALWVPRFAIFRTLGVLDSYVPLIAPALVGTSPLLVLLAYWSARGIPRDLIDAARLAGLGPFRVWWQRGPAVDPAHRARDRRARLRGALGELHRTVALSVRRVQGDVADGAEQPPATRTDGCAGTAGRRAGGDIAAGAGVRPRAASGARRHEEGGMGQKLIRAGLLLGLGFGGAACGGDGSGPPSGSLGRGAGDHVPGHGRSGGDARLQGARRELQAATPGAR